MSDDPPPVLVPFLKAIWLTWTANPLMVQPVSYETQVVWFVLGVKTQNAEEAMSIAVLHFERMLACSTYYCQTTHCIIRPCKVRIRRGLHL